MRKGWESLACSVSRSDDSEGTSSSFRREGVKKLDPGPSRWCQAIRLGAVWINEEYEESVLHCVGNHVLQHVAQIGCGVSPTWHTQESSGHNSMPCASYDPAWTGSLEQMTHCGPFQPDAFCDCVNCQCVASVCSQLWNTNYDNCWHAAYSFALAILCHGPHIYA